MKQEQKNLKHKIVEQFLPKLKNKSLFFDLQKNGYYNSVKPEFVFQFFIVNIIKEMGLMVIPIQNEGGKTHWERFEYKYSGKFSGVSDIFIPEKRTFFELKASKEAAFNKNGTLKKTQTLSNQKQFIENIRAIGYVAEFMYPENAVELLTGLQK